MRRSSPHPKEAAVPPGRANTRSSWSRTSPGTRRKCAAARRRGVRRKGRLVLPKLTKGRFIQDLNFLKKEEDIKVEIIKRNTKPRSLWWKMSPATRRKCAAVRRRGVRRKGRLVLQKLTKGRFIHQD